MATRDQPGDGWTTVLRRWPARIVEGRPEGGCTDVYEIICCDCGDHPDLDYREVSPELPRVREPYPIAAGLAAYARHIGLHRQPAHATRRTMTDVRLAGGERRVLRAGVHRGAEPEAAGRRLLLAGNLRQQESLAWEEG